MNERATESKAKKSGSPVSMPGAFRLTESGNAERLVARYRDRIRFCPPRRRWLLWDGKRWTWDERGEIHGLAKATVRSIYEEAAACTDEERRKAIGKHAHDSEKAARRNAMIVLAQSEKGIPILPAELDADPWAFNVLNGTIDLRTGKAWAPPLSRLAISSPHRTPE